MALIRDGTLEVVQQLLEVTKQCELITNFGFTDMYYFSNHLKRVLFVTQIQVIHDKDDLEPPSFRPEQVQQLQLIASRNRELARWVAMPNTHSAFELMSLILQLENCPTGRYMLARCLLGMVSFENMARNDVTTKPKQKKRRTV